MWNPLCNISFDNAISECNIVDFGYSTPYNIDNTFILVKCEKFVLREKEGASSNMRTYIKPAWVYCPHLFYYLCVELFINELASKVIGEDKVVLLYGFISIATAAGFLLFPLMRRIVHGVTGRRVLLIFAWSLNIAALLGAATFSNPYFFIISSVLVTLTAGYIGGFAFYVLAVSPTNKEYMGRFFGVASAGLLLIQYGYDFVADALGNYSLVFRLTILCLCLSLSVYKLFFYTDRTLPFAAIEKKAEPQKDMRKYLWGTLAIITIVCALMGIMDGVVTALHAGQVINVSGIPRLLCAPAMIVIGYLYDYKDRRFFPAVTMLAMIVQIIAVFLFDNASEFNIALGFLYVCGPVGSIYALAGLTEIAASTGAPDLWAVMGRASKYLTNGIMSVVGGLLFTQGNMMIFSIAYVTLLILIFAIFFTQNRLSIQRAELIRSDYFAHTADFSVAERDMAALLCQGYTHGEIAKRLSVSAASVKATLYSAAGKIEAERSGELGVLLQAAAEAYTLTDRESQMLRGLAEGKTNSELAAEFFISESTVKFHVRNLLKKISIESRYQIPDWLKEMKK